MPWRRSAMTMLALIRHPTFTPRALVLTAVLLAGCAVGPNYRRPSIDTPTAYRGAFSDAVTLPAASPETSSLGDQKWSELFQDEQLQALIQTALQQNYDLRIAA